jgi:hypothetical protein
MIATLFIAPLLFPAAAHDQADRNAHALSLVHPDDHDPRWNSRISVHRHIPHIRAPTFMLTP